MYTKLLGIISVSINVTDQLMVRFFAFIRYWRKGGSTMRQCTSHLFMDLKKDYDSVRREELYNILIEETLLLKHFLLHTLVILVQVIKI
jgi:hypothetical protein